MDDKPLTTREVARLFAVDPATVTRWADKGQLACFKTPGGHRRFRRHDVEKLRLAGEQPTARAS